MLDLARRLAEPDATVAAGAPGREFVSGWGVFSLPFDSGHVLALRVFPHNDFAPYRSLWHRDPGGNWSIYVDGPRLDTACPRYFGAAAGFTGFAAIEVSWAGPATLHVRMPEPELDWTLTARTTPVLTALNAVGARLPDATWRYRGLVRARELLARGLGMGRLRLTGTVPNGQAGTLMPREMYYVDDAAATLDGHDLGRPARLAASPTIGGVPFAARGVLAIGRGEWAVLDPAEYARVRAETERWRAGGGGPQG